MEKKKNELRKYNIGDSIFFGNYPQEADGTVRPIEWTVLKKEGNKALLFSKYILDAKPYNETLKRTTWETYDIRKWLNNEFYRAAFNSEEKIQTILLKTKISCVTSGEIETRDNVFLLSMMKQKHYFQMIKKE